MSTAILTNPVATHLTGESIEGDLIQRNNPLFGLVWINRQRISGAPCFAGTRIPIKNLFDYLESGYTLDAFLDDFDGVTREQAVAIIELARCGLIAELPNSSHPASPHEKLSQLILCLIALHLPAAATHAADHTSAAWLDQARRAAAAITSIDDRLAALNEIFRAQATCGDLPAAAKTAAQIETLFAEQSMKPSAWLCQAWCRAGDLDHGGSGMHAGRPMMGASANWN
ncbi:MAG TPA: DUF433 domain-containing protein [Tepidisphaeraceae bacterium]|jgi:uncharacterized protein (DUF433 family)|nr:DUF433 domain-containing protein [Tepidisphaeraceae bacterium]